MCGKLLHGFSIRLAAFFYLVEGRQPVAQFVPGLCRLQPLFPELVRRSRSLFAGAGQVAFVEGLVRLIKLLLLALEGQGRECGTQLRLGVPVVYHVGGNGRFTCVVLTGDTAIAIHF